MYNEIEIKLALGRIIKYISSRGYSVDFSSNAYYIVREESKVYAPKRYKSTIKCICALLHEAGHIDEPSSILLQARKSKKRDRAIIIEQEYFAWKNGLNIAQQLNICTDTLRKAYMQEWIAHWNSYLNLGENDPLDVLIDSYT